MRRWRDETARLAARRKHAKYARTCKCGRVVRGNGGWSSHQKACKVANANTPETPHD